jgi:hypothetical protein
LRYLRIHAGNGIPPDDNPPLLRASERTNMITPTETHVLNLLPSKAWIRIESPDEHATVAAGSQAALEEALAWSGAARGVKFSEGLSDDAERQERGSGFMTGERHPRAV